ncbi:sulfotransferase family protein [Epibacterium ulvae]|uniref:sulfotransferase family protein n=1 Tax=Epibacterium ulvae TaxID=1156985 RepID=UPI002490FE3D|nr:sulfotransferase [Epibacterium ulvae]
MTQHNKTFPNLFLLGAPKSGTTFIFGLMQNAPDVFTSYRKEPAYFLVYGQKIKYKERFVTPLPSSVDEDKYCDLYAGQEERYIIDASTHYLSSPETAERIHAASPDAKVIAVLREPISRAYSHYLMGVRDGFVTEDFVGALTQEKKEMQDPDVVWSEHYRFIRRSLYLDGLKAFHARFGDNLRVYMFDDIKANPNFIIDDLCDFLDLPSADLEARIEDAERNPYAVDRFPLLTRLVQRYRESPLRHMVNRLTPVSLRDKLRMGFDKQRLKHAPKPKLEDDARQILVDALGDDFEASIAFAKETNILKQAEA